MSLFSLCSNKIQECFNSQTYFDEDKVQISKRIAQRNPAKKDLRNLIQQEYDNKKQSLKRKNVQRKNIELVPELQHAPLQKVMSAPKLQIKIPEFNIQRKIYKSPTQLPRAIFQYKSPIKTPYKVQQTYSPRKCEIKFNYFTKKIIEKSSKEKKYEKSEHKSFRQQQLSMIKQSTSPSQQHAPLKESEFRTNIKKADSIEERTNKIQNQNSENFLSRIKVQSPLFNAPKMQNSQHRLRSNIAQHQLKNSEQSPFFSSSIRQEPKQRKLYKSEKGVRSMGIIMKDMELAESIPDEDENEDSFSEVIERSFHEVSAVNMNLDNQKMAFMSLRDKDKEIQPFNFLSDKFFIQRKGSENQLF